MGARRTARPRAQITQFGTRSAATSATIFAAHIGGDECASSLVPVTCCARRAYGSIGGAGRRAGLARVSGLGGGGPAAGLALAALPPAGELVMPGVRCRLARRAGPAQAGRTADRRA